MREQLLNMGSNLSNFYPYQQNDLWQELIRAISISKQLAFVYASSIKDLKPNSNELLNAFNKSNEKTHFALERYLNSFIAQKYDDGHDKAPDIETCHDQTQVTPGIPRFRSRSRSQERMPSSEGELLSETRTQYPCKTEFWPQTRNLNKSPCNPLILTQSRNIYWSSSNSPNQTQYQVRNKSRSQSQDRHEFGTRYSSMTRHRPQSRNVNRSPSNHRIKKKPGKRNRSRSRSHNEPQLGPRSTYSSKNRQRSQSRIRKKSRSKSLDQTDNGTEVEHQSSSKTKYDRSSRTSNKYKFNNKIRQGHDEHSPQKKVKRPFKKRKKFKSTQLTEEPPVPVVNSGTTTIPPSQAACQVQSPFYSHNVTPMYYGQPTHMPRFMPVPYYMPPRSRLPYPPTYPRMLYRPQWQPAVVNFNTQ